MAVTVATILGGYTTFIASIIATADSDTTSGNVAHGLAGTPLLFGVTPVLSQALTALSAWTLAIPGTTNLVGTKLASTGSGNAGIQAVIWCMLPHSLIK